MRRFAALLAVLTGPAIWAQDVISAKSGMVHFVEGSATINGTKVKVEKFKFPEVKEGQTLVTTDGRVEVLLNPGVFLRVAENSSLTMISNKLTDTQIKLNRGEALLEVSELPKDTLVTIHVGDATIHPLTPGNVNSGLYQIDAEGRMFRVYDGKAEVELNKTSLKLKAGQSTPLTPELKMAKFNKKKADALYAWSAVRSNTVAAANRVVARTASNTKGYVNQGSMWAYYPTLGMFTFLPGSGRAYSPFGWYYYSPRTIWILYTPDMHNPGYQSASDGGWNNRGSSSSGQSSAAVAASSGNVGPSASSGGAAPSTPSVGGARGR